MGTNFIGVWRHLKLKKEYVGNYEIEHYKENSVPQKPRRILRLEHRNSKGVTVGKVYTFGSWQAAKKAGWVKA